MAQNRHYLEPALSGRFARAIVHALRFSAERCEIGLGNDRWQERVSDLTDGAPERRTEFAQEGETPNSLVSGSTSKIIRRFDNIHGFAGRGPFTGGERKPIKLFDRLNASSIRHRMR